MRETGMANPMPCTSSVETIQHSEWPKQIQLHADTSINIIRSPTETDDTVSK